MKIFYSLLFCILLTTSLTAQIYDKKLTSVVASGNSEGEACMAIDPLDSNRMVIGFMESTSTDLLFRTYYSTDAGNSWTLSNFNFKSTLAADYPGRSVAGGGDILLAYDKNGKLYSTWLYATVTPSFDTLGFSVLWAESTDGGVNFTMQPGANHIMGWG